MSGNLAPRAAWLTSAMRMTAPADDPIVRRAAEGDRKAWRVLLDRHGPMVWAICRRLSPDAEDAYQEIWEKVFGAIGGFDPAGPAPLGAYIATIAHRHLVDRHRRRVVRGEVLPLGDIPTASDAEERLDGARSHERLELALQRLPSEQRRVVVMHHLHGRPLDEIAVAEGVAVGTVKSRLHRGRAKLCELLGGER